MKSTKTLSIIAIASIMLMSFTPSPVVIKNESFRYAALVYSVLWEKESYDFGEIAQGKPVSVDFTFTNNGDEPVLISDVVTSCGCTASDYSKAPIMPHKSSTIKVTYNAANLGTFTKSITVNFSDAASKKVLMIKGIVK
jgi:Protein of unknown function (DUF1573)